MASISKLVNPSPVCCSSSLSGSPKLRPFQAKCLIDFQSRDVFNARVSSSRLSVRSDVVRASLRCEFNFCALFFSLENLWLHDAVIL